MVIGLPMSSHAWPLLERQVDNPKVLLLLFFIYTFFVKLPFFFRFVVLTISSQLSLHIPGTTSWTLTLLKFRIWIGSYALRCSFTPMDSYKLCTLSSATLPSTSGFKIQEILPSEAPLANIHRRTVEGVPSWHLREQSLRTGVPAEEGQTPQNQSTMVRGI